MLSVPVGNRGATTDPVRPTVLPELPAIVASILAGLATVGPPILAELLAIPPPVLTSVLPVPAPVLPEILPGLASLLPELAEMIDLTGAHRVGTPSGAELIVTQLPVVVIVEPRHPVGVTALRLRLQRAASEPLLLLRESSVAIFVEPLDQRLLMALDARPYPRLRKSTLTRVQATVLVRVELAHEELARRLRRLQPVVDILATLLPKFAPVITPLPTEFLAIGTTLLASVLSIRSSLLPKLLTVRATLLAKLLTIGATFLTRLLPIVTALLATLDPRGALRERG
jgi:hypothetical protein